MAIYYVSNENGDWWRFDPQHSLYILDTDDLPEDVAKEWGYLDEDGNPNPDNDDWADDSLIWEYGTAYPQGNLLK